MYCLKKEFIYLLGIILIGFNYSCSKYKKLSSEYNDENQLIKYVHPDKAYSYWEFDTAPALKNDNIIYSYGKKPKGVTFEQVFFTQLFVGCQPAMCSKYIAYISDGKVGYVTTPTQLKEFIGKIDNLQEAVLLSKATYQLQVDDNTKGGAYFMSADTIFNLRLTKYISCPETKKSLYLKIERTAGVVDTATIETFYKGKDCIVY